MYAEVMGEQRLVEGAADYPLAGALAALAAEHLASGTGDGVLTSPSPIYLRRPDARVPGPPKKVTA